MVNTKITQKLLALQKEAAPLLRQINELFLGEENYLFLDHFKPLADDILLYFFDLPALGDESKNEANTLYIQALGKVLAGLKKFATMRLLESIDGYTDPVTTRKMRERWQYAISVAGLFDSFPQLLSFRIKTGNVVWNPVTESLYDFLNNHGESYSLEPLTLDDIKQHCGLSAFFLARFFPTKEISFLGETIFYHLLDSMSNKPFEGNRISPFVLSPVSNNTGTKAPILSDKSKLFCDAIVSLNKKAQVGFATPNTLGSRLWIGSEYTALVCPNGVKEVLEYLKETGTHMPSDTKAVYNLLDEKCLLRRSGESLQNVHRLILKLKDRINPIALNVVLIKNVNIWGDTSPDIFNGDYCFAVPDDNENFVKTHTPNKTLLVAQGVH